MRVTEMTNPIDRAPSFQGWRLLVGASAAPVRWIYASWVDRFPGVEVEAEAKFPAGGGAVSGWEYRAHTGTAWTPVRHSLVECLADVSAALRP